MLLKLKIGTKMRKGKYVSKIKTDHLGKDLYSRTTIYSVSAEKIISDAFSYSENV